MGLSARLVLGAVDLGDRIGRRPDARARPVHALGLRAAGAVPDRDQFRALARRPLFLEQARHGIYADVARRDVLFPDPRRRPLFARSSDRPGILRRLACHLSTPMAYACTTSLP